MKILFFFFLAISFTKTATSQLNKHKNDLSAKEVRGQVKSISEFTIYEKTEFGKTYIDDTTLTNYLEYNKDGFILVDNSYAPSREKQFDTKYSYSEDGKLILRVFTDVENASKVATTFKYDKNNLLSKTLDDNSRVSFKSKYAYDSLNRKVSETTYGNQEKKPSKVSYSYKTFQDTMLITKTVTNSSGMIGSISYSYYDKNNNLIRQEFFPTPNENPTVLENIYHNNLIVRHSSNISYTWFYNHEDNGLLLAKIAIDPTTGSLVKSYQYSYEFDKKGNWIAREILLNNTLFESKTRVFVYYD